MSYAGFWRRFLALLIDGFLIMAVYLAIRIAATNLGWRFEPSSELIVDDQGIYRRIESFRWSPIWTLMAIMTVIDWLYHAIMQSSAAQATVGKIIMGIYLTDMTGQRIGFARATVRYIASIASGIVFLLGYLIMPLTARKQALHDMVAGTLVVREFAPSADIR
ncbi:MAG: RDD family protein [Dongiaceae bacterium]